jgi:hypothetical protein
MPDLSGLYFIFNDLIDDLVTVIYDLPDTHIELHLHKPLLLFFDSFHDGNILHYFVCSV